IEKIKIGTAPDGTRYIACMDALLEDDPHLYEQYAMRDAEISARYVKWMLRFQEQNGLSGSEPAITIPNLALQYLLKFWRETGTAPEEVNGITVSVDKSYVQHSNKPEGRRWYSKKIKTPHLKYEQWEGLAKRCYHGGRNE